jgi:hypothetical protein
MARGLGSMLTRIKAGCRVHPGMARRLRISHRLTGEVRFGSWPWKNGLGEVGPRSQDHGVSQAAIAVISGLTPTMLMTRVRL